MKQSLAITGSLSQPTLLFIVLGIVLTACGRVYYTSNTSSIDTANFAAELATINLNTASAAELDKLPGIGPVLAERIVTHRQENGPFRRPEHLMMVRGISDRKFRALRSMVRVE
ncbi:MAG: helix-hairpin-helix domain-containing protein [Acidobacteriota bacterium]|nr:helix-hairpin-helix domain-containing protein [Acidobacteriota bacterium]